MWSLEPELRMYIEQEARFFAIVWMEISLDTFLLFTRLPLVLWYSAEIVISWPPPSKAAILNKTTAKIEKIVDKKDAKKAQKQHDEDNEDISPTSIEKNDDGIH